MTTLRFCSLDYQHATWLSNNRMADPVTGSDSDGFLLSAALGGFHNNFDACVLEESAQSVGATATGTGATVGQIAIPGMTATGSAIVTAQEDLGVGFVISHIVPGVGLITVYQRDVLDAGLGAATPVDTKKVAVQVISLS